MTSIFTRPFTFSQLGPCRVCRGFGRVLVGNKRGELLTCAACRGTGTEFEPVRTPPAGMTRSEWKAAR